MGLCALGTALALSWAGPGFALEWTHSVERVTWREQWRVEGQQLVLDEARVRGSGAGMEPPEGSVLLDGWWVYRADRRVEALHLAVSGATVGGWRLCPHGLACLDLEAALTAPGGAPPEAITLQPGPCPAGLTPVNPVDGAAPTRR